MLVIDDCSTDGTIAAARAAGAEVLPMPHHLGLGGCVQAGYKLAFELGYRLRDSRGWRRPARCRAISRASSTRLKTSGCEMVIGSRFVSDNGSAHRRGALARHPFLPPRAAAHSGQAVHDPTSGFVGVNRRALNVFRSSFPLEYPEIEALVVLQRRTFRFEEVPCKMRPRTTGRSSITALKSLYYMVHVLLGVFVNVLKFERRFCIARRRAAIGDPAGPKSEDRWIAS